MNIHISKNTYRGQSVPVNVFQKVSEWNTGAGGISTISRFNAADSDSKMAGKSIKLKWSIKKIITLS